MALEGRVAVVTGTAEPGGIGIAIARALASDGATVIAVDWAPPGPSAHEAPPGDHAGTIVPCVANLTDESAVSAVFARALEVANQLDILVCCPSAAGAESLADCPVGGAQGDFLGVTSCSLDQWRATLSHHLDAAFLCAHAAAQQLMRQRGGQIVNVASLAARRGVYPAAFAASGPLAVAEAGLLGLTKQLAIELAPYGVRVNAVVPGLIATRRNRELLDRLGDAQRAAHLYDLPLGRVGTTDEVAAVVLALCTGAASYLTGVTLDINGGAFLA